MAKQESPSENGVKQKGGYPYYVLKNCLRLGAVVKQHGGERAGVPKSVVARAMDADQGSSAFSTQVASAKNFGVIEGTSELRLTENGREYFFPTAANGSRLAELEFLAHPPAFAFLIKQFDGSRLASTQIIANQLGKHCGVPASWRLRVAQIFISAATDLGVLDQNGFLRYGAAKHTAGGSSNSTATLQMHGMQSQPDRSPPAQAAVGNMSGSADDKFSVGGTFFGVKTNTWIYGEAGGMVRLETSDPLPRDLWDRLTRYVKMLEPAKADKEG
jgi:hypothetical protein